MACSRTYLPLCSIPARMSRDGLSGPNARVYLPFHGFHFFNGSTYEFPYSTIPQNRQPYIGGVTRSLPFQKEGCSCG